ncbi:hypothetical protein NEOLEDRAFT_1242861 [Neolentinus lepideus HHB14362 ss-1]|uniref:F-box domain-containing protein n=1 Tax=Neolentinus lepideus HHB14362 ss-1 TaxID=1314782 RepID=A0A165RJT4_9AGAM|nr:hypothetical protein NEOLEDRAFT_1242861 [Neolentinus lepideus HHB14362 ss-1]
MDKEALLTETDASPPDESAFVVETRKEIEEKISEHYTEIIGLRRRLNALLPTARLPPELLAEIFLAYMNTHENSAFYSFSRYEYHRRFYIAQVCQHWRQVALEDPRLWANIDLSAGPRYVKEMLFRSKKAPLAISGNVSSYEDSSASFELILAELSRVHVIDLIVTRSFLQEFHTTGPRNVPCLRVLKLSRSQDRVTLPLPFLSTLLLSNLEDLSVEGFPLDSFRMLVLPSLTSFSWTTSSVKSTVSSLLTLLRNTPLLCTLIFSYSFMSSDESTTQPNVNLPQLIHLTIRCAPTPCAELLAHLSFPAHATTEIVVQPLSVVPAERSLTALGLIAVAMRDILESEPLRTFVIDSDACYVEFNGWTTVLPRDSRRESLEPKFSLVVFDSGDLWKAAEVVEVVASKLPLSNVDCLKLDGVCGFRTWKRAFRRMVHLTQLHVCETAAYGLPAALGFHSHKKKVKKAVCADANMIATEDDLDPHIRLFPRLEYIRLEEVQFYKVYEAPEDKDFMKQFERALKSMKYDHHKFPHVDILRAVNFA